MRQRNSQFFRFTCRAKEDSQRKVLCRVTSELYSLASGSLALSPAERPCRSSRCVSCFGIRQHGLEKRGTGNTQTLRQTLDPLPFLSFLFFSVYSIVAFISSFSLFLFFLSLSLCKPWAPVMWLLKSEVKGVCFIVRGFYFQCSPQSDNVTTKARRQAAVLSSEILFMHFQWTMKRVTLTFH